jgi:methylmalonyl-CoA mutase N-terminal domain/subunit
MRERFQASDPKSWRLRFHTQTGGSTLTAQQPENNIVRVALQALAAVMGGTQSLHTNSMDEALGLPTERAVRIALRTQQIIANESGVVDTIDPLGGAYAIEYLTDELEQKANRYIENIDALGGMLNAIESGYINNEIDEAAYAFQRALEQDEQIVVGVNRFVEEENVTPPILRIDPAIEAGQRERVGAVRARRDSERVSALRQQLTGAARARENLMPLFIECVENDVTLGEICNTLREVWGEYRPSFVF